VAQYLSTNHSNNIILWYKIFIKNAENK